MSMRVHFAEELWTIKTVIVHTFSLWRVTWKLLAVIFQPKFVRMPNHSFHMCSTASVCWPVLLMHLFCLTAQNKHQNGVRGSQFGTGFVDCGPKQLPGLLKFPVSSMSESFTLACVYKRRDNIGVNCRWSLPMIRPVFYQSVCTQIQSWPKAKQWLREVKEWDSVNRYGDLAPHHIHTLSMTRWPHSSLATTGMLSSRKKAQV